MTAVLVLAGITLALICLTRWARSRVIQTWVPGQCDCDICTKEEW